MRESSAALETGRLQALIARFPRPILRGNGLVCAREAPNEEASPTWSATGPR